MSQALSPSDVLRRNLLEVFAENDRTRRDAAIDELYEPSATFQDEGDQVDGTAALKDHVAALLGRFDGLGFTLAGPTTHVGDLGRADWLLGPEGGPSVASGTDVGLVQDGRIVRLWTFVDPAPS